MSPRSRYRTLAAILTIIAIGTLLRLYELGKISLWFDEAIVVSRAGDCSQPFSTEECAPPLFILAAHYWKALGTDEFSLRLLPAVCGILTVLAVYILGKGCFGARTGLTAAFITAISPLQIFYSREFTGYSLFALLVVVAVYFLKKARETDKPQAWFAFALFTSLSVFTHYAGAIFLFAEVVFFLSAKSPRKARWALSHLLILLFLFPAFSLIVRQMDFAFRSGITWWVSAVTPKTIPLTFKNFSSGYNAGPGVFYPASVIFTALFLYGLRSIKASEDRDMFSAMLFIPLLAAAAVSLLGIRIYVDRYLIPASLFFYLVTAKGLSGLQDKRIRFCGLFAMAALSGFSLVNYYGNHLPNPPSHHRGVQINPDFRSAARYIGDNFRSQDLIIHTNENSIPPLDYYISRFNDKDRAGAMLRSSRWFRVEQPGILKVVPFSIRQQVLDGSGMPETGGEDLAGYSRIWLVVHRSEGYERSLPVLSWMQRHYQQVAKNTVYGLDTYLFIKKR